MIVPAPADHMQMMLADTLHIIKTHGSTHSWHACVHPSCAQHAHTVGWPSDPDTFLLQGYRMRLGADANGRRYGITAQQSFAQTWMPLFPPIILALVLRCVLRGWPAMLAPVVTCLPPVHMPTPLPHAVPVLAGFGSLLSSMAAAYLLIPSAVRAQLANCNYVYIRVYIHLKVHNFAQ